MTMDQQTSLSLKKNTVMIDDKTALVNENETIYPNKPYRSNFLEIPKSNLSGQKRN